MECMHCIIYLLEQQILGTLHLLHVLVQLLLHRGHLQFGILEPLLQRLCLHLGIAQFVRKASVLELELGNTSWIMSALVLDKKCG